MSVADVSGSAGRYLSAILLLSRRNGRPAKTGEIAERLDVSAASVTERLADLEERGLAEYEKYHGVELTDDGEAVTRELMWKRCLAENFLDEDLDLPDADGSEVGPALSDDVATALKALIDHPCDGACEAPHTAHDACREEVRKPN
ncbi:metal-dependent transcriptional regulator [Halospeciosus flavus]|uniref:Metal-dependent transcriptional regulator n=1 Tax=Halospeciosus flavus TaxID=3032283 RepID=A0ABD5Z6H5_9EURY|nr:metal-dependent transcriptional regulator [Halospeciosus flavus]